MALLNKILVFAENSAAYSELCAGGFQLGKEVVATVLGTKDMAEQVSELGAKTYWLGEKADGRMLEDYTTEIAKVISKEKPTLILIRSSKRGRLIAGKLSVMLEAGIVTDATEFEVESESSVRIKHLVYGGTAVRTEKPRSEIAIALIGSGLFEVLSSSVKGELIVVENVEPQSTIICRETRPKQGESVDLGSARRVIGVGRGIASQDDLAMVQELASAISAEMACSRPIAEGVNWMPKSRYIGVSGAMIKPDLYLAAGISGQVQHMVGVSNAKTIVAVNKDKNAPIFQQADYGIVGDIYKVIPALTELLKKQ